MESYTNKLKINAPVGKVYEAITTQEGLSSWWTRKCGVGAKVGEEAVFHFDEDFSKFRIEKLVANKEVVWHCTDQHFSVEGSSKTDEWVGTTVGFRLSEKDGGTLVSFVHEGLTPKLDCFEVCNAGWDYFLDSLKNYLETGTGTPYVSE